MLLPADPRLPAPVASHPDMLLYVASDRIITSRFYYERIATQLLDEICRQSGLSLQCTDETVCDTYPHDILFNAACVGHRIFCLPSYTSRAILDAAAREQRRIIPVRQGYARCSICPVGDHALITADPSIYRATRAENAPSALLVRSGHISLPGYPYGFLGGCVGTDGHRLYVCGDLSTHADSAAIFHFLNEHGITPVSLSDGPLTDCGSLFFITDHSPA